MPPTMRSSPWLVGMVDSGDLPELGLLLEVLGIEADDEGTPLFAALKDRQGESVEDLSGIPHRESM